MAKIRVYELAKELKISSKELIGLLIDEFNIQVKNHMSVLEEEDAELIKELFAENNKNKESANDLEEDTVETNIETKYENLEEETRKLQNGKNNKITKNTKKKIEPEKQPKKEAELDNTKSADSETAEVEIDDVITVNEFAKLLNKPSTEVIKQLIFMGVMAAINQEIDFETAKKLGAKFDITVNHKEKQEAKIEEDLEKDDTQDEHLVKRPPVVTVMGHVDHGKTSLLDAVRKAHVTSTEAGGITQHIGAYTVNINGQKITFLDTPGHEAFTAMRARGAQMTDIAVLVVAADDGIMPQTVEAINHCKAANVPIVVAINKIDKPGANIDRVKQELTEYGLVAEDWGGDVICVPVSAKTHDGIDNLLEMILLSAEMLELKANPKRKAKGTVIEAKLDKGRGSIASLIVQNGTLHTGDSILVGSTYGRIRAMFDDKGKKIKNAGPSIPVEVLGLSEVPNAGDRFYVIKDEKTARTMAESRKEKQRIDYLKSTHGVSLEDLYNQIREGKIKELNLIVKADVQGSVEALKQSLEKLSSDTVKVRVIHSAVGAITETDVILAAASSAIIIGFNVRPEIKATQIAEKEKIDIKTYRIIYDAINDVKAAMEGLLEPEYKEVVLGSAEVRQIYKISSIGTIAGCYVLNGKITRNSSARLIRNGIVIAETTFASLKRFKDDAKEVQQGFECGVGLDKFNDIKEKDVIESYTMQEVKKTEL